MLFVFPYSITFTMLILHALILKPMTHVQRTYAYALETTFAPSMESKVFMHTMFYIIPYAF